MNAPQLELIAVAPSEEEDESTDETGLAVQATDELTKSFINAKRAEYQAYGSTAEHKRIVSVFDALDSGKKVISLVGTIENNVGARNERETVDAGICRADATKIIGYRHPNGSFAIQPNRGPHFVFEGLLPSQQRVTASKGKIRPPAIPPGQQFDRTTHFLLWAADWVASNQPPGVVYVLSQLSDDIYIVEDYYEISRVEALVANG